MKFDRERGRPKADERERLTGEITGGWRNLVLATSRVLGGEGISLYRG